jgi:hypothetical protein
VRLLEEVFIKIWSRAILTPLIEDCGAFSLVLMGPCPFKVDKREKVVEEDEGVMEFEVGMNYK